ncbi:hypothetical protein IAR50_004121 [Cryptococcus sp. DSM 104548]
MAFPTHDAPPTTDLQIPECLDPNTLFQTQEQRFPNTLSRHQNSDHATLPNPGQSDIAGLFLNTPRDAFRANMIQIEATSQLPVWEEESWDELLGENIMRPRHNSNEGGAIYGGPTLASRFVDPHCQNTARSSPSTSLSTSGHPLPDPFNVALELDRQYNRPFSQAGDSMMMEDESPGTALPGTMLGERDGNGHEMHSQIDLASLFKKLDHAPALTFQDAFKQSQILVNFDDDVSQMSINPDNNALKRKTINGRNDGVPDTKRRDVTIDVDNIFSFTTPLTTLAPQTLLANAPDSPLQQAAVKSEHSSPDESNASVADVKTSTARPRSVVPEKFIGDGSAETALGMSTAAIQSFPSFEELLKHVHPDNYARAKAFGEKIARNRLKAKNAAKRSRDQRRAKIEKAELLEKQTEELQGKLEGMKTLLSTLVANGTVGREAVMEYI